MTSEPSISLPPMETTASGLLVPSEPAILRVATYNIHKGVQGLGRRGGWKSTTWGWLWNSSMPTSSACRKCAR